ncbi:MAG: hypothetical protein Q8P67_23680 [archaeon]|nr:hypothetical protein [archaeon]
MAVDPNITGDELRAEIVKRLDLTESRCFFVFEQNGDFERCLDPDDKPVDLMNEWDKAESKKKDVTPKFVFKKKIFLKDDDKEMADVNAKDLVYLQGVHDVIESVYTCQVQEAIKLAALQVQATYGDHNPGIHVAGFLTKSASTNIRSFVPKALWQTKKSNDWEALILRQHSLLKGISKEDAKTEYISTIKQWQLYGTTFFPACRNTGNRNLPSKVIIGVNYEGIVLLKPKNKEIISEHLFTEICAWASGLHSFAFEFGNQSDSQKYAFETRPGLGAIIASTIQTYIDILVQMLKNVDDDESETNTLSTDDIQVG